MAGDDLGRSVALQKTFVTSGDRKKNMLSRSRSDERKSENKKNKKIEQQSLLWIIEWAKVIVLNA